ncbi:hypothetical protein J2T12_004598 [Paenibacillus anaericanus]|nr:hypothetical protein [Paenibacillus anaericanus]
MSVVISFVILQNSILCKKIETTKHHVLRPEATTEKAAITEESLQQLLSQFGTHIANRTLKTQHSNRSYAKSQFAKNARL